MKKKISINFITDGKEIDHTIKIDSDDPIKCLKDELSFIEKKYKNPKLKNILFYEV